MGTSIGGEKIFGIADLWVHKVKRNQSVLEIAGGMVSSILENTNFASQGFEKLLDAINCRPSFENPQRGVGNNFFQNFQHSKNGVCVYWAVRGVLEHWIKRPHRTRHTRVFSNPQNTSLLRFSRINLQNKLKCFSWSLWISKAIEINISIFPSSKRETSSCWSRNLCRIFDQFWVVSNTIKDGDRLGGDCLLKIISCMRVRRVETVTAFLSFLLVADKVSTPGVPKQEQTHIILSGFRLFSFHRENI